MCWILEPVSNSDILNYPSCQEPVEMTSINAQHKHCHPVSLGLSEQMELKYLDSLFIFQSFPLLSQDTWTQLQLNTKWPAFWLTDCIVLFFLLEHGSSQLLSLQNWFRKICVTNPHCLMICCGVFFGNSWILSGIHEKEEGLWLESHGMWTLSLFSLAEIN